MTNENLPEKRPAAPETPPIGDHEAAIRATLDTLDKALLCAIGALPGLSSPLSLPHNLHVAVRAASDVRGLLDIGAPEPDDSPRAEDDLPAAALRAKLHAAVDQLPPSGVDKLMGVVSAIVADARPQPEAPKEGAPSLEFRVGDGGTGDGADGISDDAAIGDVVLQMFRAAGEDGGDQMSFTDAITGSTIDELGVLMLAFDSASSVDEVPRVVERLRWRLMAARWLDSKLADAKEASTDGR